MSDVIWPGAFVSFISVPDRVCQNLIFRSLLPPPVASSDRDQGQNATAFTAALCGSKNSIRGFLRSEISHIVQELSFPPTAN